VRACRFAGRQLGAQFDALTLEQERQLVQCTFGRADAWLGWNGTDNNDAPLRGLKEVLLMGVEGYSRVLASGRRAVQSLLALDRTRY
jgi:cellulose synthase (UDP-forming)